MEQRELGTGGLVVSAVGLGCMGMSQSYGAGDDDESIRTILRAVDLGLTLLDTAESYGKGANEILVGRAIRERRGEVVVATKFGLVPNPSGGTATEVDARPERVKASCEASLRRLGLDVIDLYYLHRIDPAVPIEETVGAMGDLVRAGQVRFLGLSEAGPDNIRRAHRTHPIAALQSEYSLWTREPERTVFPVCRELGIGFVAFSPLSRGFLTGTVKDADAFAPNDVRRRLPRFQKENLEKNRTLVDELEALAQSKGCSPPQLALAWLLAKGRDLVPIPGTKRQRYVEENIAAAAIALTPADVAMLDEAFPIGTAAGARYPPDSMRLLETEQAR
jgi:aryl-alcohol dehydrogenase-like predicted oxidoreductase